MKASAAQPAAVELAADGSWDISEDALYGLFDESAVVDNVLGRFLELGMPKTEAVQRAFVVLLEMGSGVDEDIQNADTFDLDCDYDYNFSDDDGAEAEDSCGSYEYDSSGPDSENNEEEGTADLDSNCSCLAGSIASLVEMGYSDDDARAALACSDGDPGRSVGWLLARCDLKQIPAFVPTDQPHESSDNTAPSARGSRGRGRGKGRGRGAPGRSGKVLAVSSSVAKAEGSPRSVLKLTLAEHGIENEELVEYTVSVLAVMRDPAGISALTQLIEAQGVPNDAAAELIRTCSEMLLHEP